MGKLVRKVKKKKKVRTGRVPSNDSASIAKLAARRIGFKSSSSNRNPWSHRATCPEDHPVKSF